MIEEPFDSLSIVTGGGQQIAAQLVEQLTWLIASGQLETGARLPSTRRLADQLGISLHTVRAAYQRLEETGLVATRHGLGSVVLEYDPVLLSQQNDGSRTNTVGVIVPDLANPFYPEMLRGVEQAAGEYHMLLIICDTNEDPSRGKEFLDLLAAKRVDGLIIAPYGLGSGTEELATGDNVKHGVPIVYVDRPGEAGHSVLLDAEGAGFMATRHLAQLGHRRIAIISGRTGVPSLRQCFLGYLRALEQHQIDRNDDLITEVTKFSFAAGYQAARALLARPQRPTAIFAAGDLLAIGAMRAIQEQGLRVPDDIALVGYNDVGAARYVNPPLTTVHAPAFDLGVTSMQMLNQLIGGSRPEERTVVLPTRLIVRESCGVSRRCDSGQYDRGD